MSQHALHRRPLFALAAGAIALVVGLGISLSAISPASASGSDDPTPYTVTATTLTLPSPHKFTPNQEINYRVTNLDGTGSRQFGVGNNVPHNGVWPRDIYLGQSVYTWTDHPQFASYFPANTGYCVVWVQVGHFNEHFGEGGQAPLCWRPSIPEVKDAAASVQVSSPSCAAPGTPSFSITNAAWASTPPTAPGGPYTVTATAASGHVFDDGSATKAIVYSVPAVLDASGTACLRPVPVKPAFSAISTCASLGSIDLAGANAAAVHIVYSLVSGTGTDGVNVVIAEATDGYTLLSSAVASWTIDLGAYTECVAPAASSSVSACYADASKHSFRDVTVTFDNSASTTSVWFEVPGTAVARWVAAGATTSATIAVPTTGSPEYPVLGAGAELAVIPAVTAFLGCVDEWLDGDPISTDAVCSLDGGVRNGSIWVLRMEGLEYVIAEVTGAPVVISTLSGAGDGTVSVPAGYYRVTVSALPGYQLNPATAGPWWYTVAAPTQDCGQLTTETDWPTAATASDQRCTDGGTASGTITVGLIDGVSYLEEVDYFLDGSTTPLATTTVDVAPGTHTVTAAPRNPTDGLDGDDAWTLVVGSAAVGCELTTLALTGANPAGALLAGLLAVLLGAVLFGLMAVRRRRNHA